MAEPSGKEKAQASAKTAIARNQGKQDAIKARMNSGRAEQAMKKPRPRAK